MVPLKALVLPILLSTVFVFIAYGVGQLPDSIWRGQASGTTLKHVADGLVYALW